MTGLCSPELLTHVSSFFPAMHKQSLVQNIHDAQKAGRFWTELELELNDKLNSEQKAQWLELKQKLESLLSLAHDLKGTHHD